MLQKQISAYKHFRTLIEQERLHVVLSRDKRIELMRKIKPVELINCMECLLYKYEDLVRIQNQFEDYKMAVKKLSSEYDVKQALDLEDAHGIWKEYLRELSKLNLNVLEQEPPEDDELSSVLLQSMDDNEESSGADRSQLQGPINDLFFKHGIMMIYGTVSPDKEYRTILGERAYAFVNLISQNIKVKIPIKRDVDITGEDIKNYHLILFGGLGVNDLAEEIYDELPIPIERDIITLGDMKFAGEDTRLIMLSPNPLNPDKYVLLYNALGIEGVADIFGLYHGPTDFVLGNDYNWIARGFFDKSDETFWQYNPDGLEINEPVINLLNKKGWENDRSEHYIYYFKKKSIPARDIDFIIKLHEDNYDFMVETTKLNTHKAVEVYLFETNDEKEQIMGARSDGSFDPYLPRLYLVYNDPIADFGPEKILHSMYQHIDWSELHV